MIGKEKLMNTENKNNKSKNTSTFSSDKWKTFFKRYYMDNILILSNEYPDKNSLTVSFHDLEMFDRRLSEELLENPFEMIPLANSAIADIDLPIEKTLESVTVRFIDIPYKVLNRDLRSKHLMKFISIEGMIRKATEVRPKITNAAFYCLRCEHITYVLQTGQKFIDPLECENDSCGRKGPFKILISKSTFVDAQKLQIQESPESLKGGSQPQSLDAEVENDLAGIVKPGDRVIINGILNSHQRTLRDGKSPFYDLILNANSLIYLEKEFDELEITPEDEQEILNLSNNKQVYEKIVRSIAPSIYGYTEIKEALALQLFSGVPKFLPDGTRIRGDIHILLMGDPGVAKSQLLRYIVKLAPRGVYASGRSASSAGLTAAAVKDDLGDGRWTIEAGALVMADMGIAAVDELDKMRAEDKSSLHEAMEQQTISVAKAGILATLKSRCALLAAANPKYGRFDRHEMISGQINVPPALLSRFDLLFILQDVPNNAVDARIANHIVSAHYAGELSEHKSHIPSSNISQEQIDSQMELIVPEIDPELMRKYIAYARKNIYPIMEEDARKHLVNFYRELRSMGEGTDAPVPVTARQLEALVRISEASSRTRLSNVVTMDDAKRTTAMVHSCLKSVGADPVTGIFDADRLASGTTKSQRDKIKIIKEIIKNLVKISPVGKALLEDVYVDAESKDIDKTHAEELIIKMSRSGDILKPDNNHIRLT